MSLIRAFLAIALSVGLTACGGNDIDDSLPNEVVLNSAPVASAGPLQNVTTGTVVTLNGSTSSDANGDPLTYAWTLSSRPAGSAAALTGASSAAPTFTADVAGTLRGIGLSSTTVRSTAPLRRSRSPRPLPMRLRWPMPVQRRSITTGTVVTLNGSTSSDANGDPLTYAWTLSSRPAGSAAVLTGASSAAPTFTADVAGTYVASLVVNDGKVNSTAATVTITATVANAAPVANAGAAQNVTTGTVVTLNGSTSSDANGDPLTYAWTLSSRPAGSAAALHRCQLGSADLHRRCRRHLRGIARRQRR